MLLASAQLSPHPQSTSMNVASVVRVVEKYPEVALIAFPELFLSGYNLNGIDARSISVDSPEVRQIQSVADQTDTSIIVGFAERLDAQDRTDGHRLVANSALCIDSDGRLAAVYRKTHLFGPETGLFVPGNEVIVVDLGGRRIAPLICFDIEFPEPARLLAREGSELLVTIAANMSPYTAEQLLAVKARALENRLTHLYVNRIGREGDLQFEGGSQLVASDGVVVARLGDEDRVLVADSTNSLQLQCEREIDYLRHIRTDLIARRVTRSVRSDALPQAAAPEV